MHGKNKRQVDNADDEGVLNVECSAETNRTYMYMRGAHGAHDEHVGVICSGVQHHTPYISGTTAAEQHTATKQQLTEATEERGM